MSENITSNQLTLFVGGSLASHSVRPGSSEAKQMTVTSGLRCLELFGNSSHVGLLARMLLASSVWNSTARLLIWKPKGITSSRLYFQLVPSALLTDETEFLFWPTARTSTANGASQKEIDLGNPKTRLETAIMIYEGKDSTGKVNPQFVEWLMGFPIGWTDLED